MATKKSENSGSVIKAKSLFDHINHIREVQDPKYFDTLTDADVKSWSNYMICRFLSMQSEIIENVNEIQVFASTLKPREFYQLCLLIVPKGRAFYTYIKGGKSKWPAETLELLCRIEFQESEANVLEYLDLMTLGEVSSLLGKYGYTEKEIKKMLPKN